jgi:hypothetical protein
LFPNSGIASELYVVNLKITIDSLPTLQILLEIVTLFEKIYDGEPILTVISNIVEDVQYCCFNQVYDMKSVSQPDTIALVGNNYSLQVIETGFAKQSYASRRTRPALIRLKISVITA